MPKSDRRALRGQIEAANRRALVAYAELARVEFLALARRAGLRDEHSAALLELAEQHGLLRLTHHDRRGNLSGVRTAVLAARTLFPGAFEFSGRGAWLGLGLEPVHVVTRYLLKRS